MKWARDISNDLALLKILNRHKVEKNQKSKIKKFINKVSDVNIYNVNIIYININNVL